MDTKEIQKILIIGGGPTEIGHETELDAACVQIIQAFKKQGIRSLLIDNNPFSAALEDVQPTNVFIQAVTADNVQRIIENEHPDAILPTVGGVAAISVIQELQENGVLTDNNVQTLGIPASAMMEINNPDRLNDVMRHVGMPVIASETIGTLDEAINVANEIGYPVIVKPIAPRIDTNRMLCENESDMINAVSRGLSWSRFKQCVIEQSIVGYKEIELVSMRDTMGTQVLIAGLENIDPIGIHSGDSMVVTPTLTLSNVEYESLRDTAFAINNQFRFTGVVHTHFALRADGESYYVTKVTPYNDRGTSLAACATGYPIAYVAANLYLNQKLTDVRLPEIYHFKQTAILEPSLDHVVVRIPLWPFEDIKNADKHLGTVMKSVGSTIGIGRSTEEAILKALRSSQFSPQDELPSMSNLTDSQIISQLIHPLSSRILVLLEALRRGYQVDELNELTKIDQFYFVKFKHILDIEKDIKTHPMSIEALRKGRYYGFGDGMIAKMWQTDIETVRQLGHDNHISPTYKGIEPSAGELSGTPTGYYSTFELKNESQQLSNKTVLVLGRGGNQLGPNASADYFTTEMLKQLRKSGYQTVIMNTNPNAGSLTATLTDKQIIDPVQLGDIMNVIAIERPVKIFVPGNRHYLTRELRRRNYSISILPPDQEKRSELLSDHANIGLDLFVAKGHIVPILASDLRSDQGIATTLNQITLMRNPATLTTQQLDAILKHAKAYLGAHKRTGMVQMLYTTNGNSKQMPQFAGVRPTRLTTIAYLNKVTGINWVRMLVRQALGEIDEKLIAKWDVDIHSERRSQVRGTFPFKQLQLPDQLGLTTQEVGAKISFETL
ncbi:carbamoyl phosphate synthase large subunit [Secundilactobacillus pentosiphilus]|uniref:Carbamoyl phosphate synthase large subunit n=1 Tax=Secundilactobacillus pentosiphilus TaxID=1714682 RepID=A0A1Z5IVA4_9LACO|nr:carbamoyl phosphate synthase [Secundilactobacillus pentosiphilus]GAX05532.1 carbamoyl phosphate synthase large subunit [Secundilactobacillus pentosiphilus]